MSDTQTPARSVGLEGSSYIVRGGGTSSTGQLPYTASGTFSLSRMTRNAMMPFLFGLAAFTSPAAPLPGIRRMFSDAAISRSAVSDQDWFLDLDPFVFTQEFADPEAVRELYALLELPLTTGFELELPD
jgi:hypothetical protein